MMKDGAEDDGEEDGWSNVCSAFFDPGRALQAACSGKYHVKLPVPAVRPLESLAKCRYVARVRAIRDRSEIDRWILE